MEPEYEQGPFELLYEAWVASGPRGQRDPALERQIAETYRDAWASGLTNERWAVLYAIFDLRDASGSPLIVEGLRSDDRDIADHAAVIASVFDHYGLIQSEPELRRAFRELARRFPERDAARPPHLYGHEPGDVDDTAERPFLNLYEDWMAEDPPDDDILRQLVQTYRDAWASGDGVDRAFVLHFLTRIEVRADPNIAEARENLLIEALEMDDAVLAPTAGFYAWCHVTDGATTSPRFRTALERHVERFPSTFGPRFGPAAWALRDLNKRDPKRD